MGLESWSNAKELRLYLLNREITQLGLCFRKVLSQQLERLVGGRRTKSGEQVIAIVQVRKDKDCYEL